MNIWKAKDWKEIYKGYEIRGGLRLRCDKGVDPEVRRACREFCKWLRSEYEFPMRIPIYLKNVKELRTRDGKLAYGLFIRQFYFLDECYIKIAVGDYDELLEERGKDNALVEYLYCIAHELTHYYQWLNQWEMSEEEEEKQADRLCNVIINRYEYTREHP